MVDWTDVPPHVVVQLREICMALPEVQEDTPWTGARWSIRKRNFAHVHCIDGPNGPVTYVDVRAEGEERDMLEHVGHPFFPGWGPGVIGMVLDDATDWEEVREVVTDSYCLLAPKKLSALVVRPED
jgi:predicted DNA-binding protein (MmcQ/YjbR family)